MVHSGRMKPASVRGSLGEVPGGNQAGCGGGIPGSHRQLGGVPCVVASGVSKTTAGNLLPPMSRCPKDLEQAGIRPVRADGSHPYGRSAVSGSVSRPGSEAVTAKWPSRGILRELCVLMVTPRGLV